MSDYLNSIYNKSVRTELQSLKDLLNFGDEDDVSGYLSNKYEVMGVLYESTDGPYSTVYSIRNKITGVNYAAKLFNVATKPPKIDPSKSLPLDLEKLSRRFLAENALPYHLGEVAVHHELDKYAQQYLPGHFPKIEETFLTHKLPSFFSSWSETKKGGPEHRTTNLSSSTMARDFFKFTPQCTDFMGVQGIIMEQFEATLEDLIVQGQTLSEKEQKQILVQVVMTLAYAQKKLDFRHGNLVVRNVMLRRSKASSEGARMYEYFPAKFSLMMFPPLVSVALADFGYSSLRVNTASNFVTSESNIVPASPEFQTPDGYTREDRGSDIHQFVESLESTLEFSEKGSQYGVFLKFLKKYKKRFAENTETWADAVLSDRGMLKLFRLGAQPGQTNLGAVVIPFGDATPLVGDPWNARSATKVYLEHVEEIINLLENVVENLDTGSFEELKDEFDASVRVHINSVGDPGDVRYVKSLTVETDDTSVLDVIGLLRRVEWSCVTSQNMTLNTYAKFAKSLDDSQVEYFMPLQLAKDIRSTPDFQSVVGVLVKHLVQGTLIEDVQSILEGNFARLTREPQLDFRELSDSDIDNAFVWRFVRAYVMAFFYTCAVNELRKSRGMFTMPLSNSRTKNAYTEVVFFTQVNFVNNISNYYIHDVCIHRSLGVLNRTPDVKEMKFLNPFSKYAIVINTSVGVDVSDLVGKEKGEVVVTPPYRAYLVDSNLMSFVNSDVNHIFLTEAPNSDRACLLEVVHDVKRVIKRKLELPMEDLARLHSQLTSEAKRRRFLRRKQGDLKGTLKGEFQDVVPGSKGFEMEEDEEEDAEDGDTQMADGTLKISALSASPIGTTILRSSQSFDNLKSITKIDFTYSTAKDFSHEYRVLRVITKDAGMFSVILHIERKDTAQKRVLKLYNVGIVEGDRRIPFGNAEPIVHYLIQRHLSPLLPGHFPVLYDWFQSEKDIIPLIDRDSISPDIQSSGLSEKPLQDSMQFDDKEDTTKVIAVQGLIMSEHSLSLDKLLSEEYVLTDTEQLHIVFQLAFVMAFAFETLGFVHGDLNLGNILLTRPPDAPKGQRHVWVYTWFNGDTWYLEDPTVYATISDFGASFVRVPKCAEDSGLKHEDGIASVSGLLPHHTEFAMSEKRYGRLAPEQDLAKLRYVLKRRALGGFKILQKLLMGSTGTTFQAMLRYISSQEKHLSVKPASLDNPSTVVRKFGTAASAGLEKELTPKLDSTHAFKTVVGFVLDHVTKSRDFAGEVWPALKKHITVQSNPDEPWRTGVSKIVLSVPSKDNFTTTRFVIPDSFKSVRWMCLKMTRRIRSLILSLLAAHEASGSGQDKQFFVEKLYENYEDDNSISVEHRLVELYNGVGSATANPMLQGRLEYLATYFAASMYNCDSGDNKSLSLACERKLQFLYRADDEGMDPHIIKYMLSTMVYIYALMASMNRLRKSNRFLTRSPDELRSSYTLSSSEKVMETWMTVGDKRVSNALCRRTFINEDTLAALLNAKKNNQTPPLYYMYEPFMSTSYLRPVDITSPPTAIAGHAQYSIISNNAVLIVEPISQFNINPFIYSSHYGEVLLPPYRKFELVDYALPTAAQLIDQVGHTNYEAQELKHVLHLREMKDTDHECMVAADAKGGVDVLVSNVTANKRLLSDAEVEEARLSLEEEIMRRKRLKYDTDIKENEDEDMDTNPGEDLDDAMGTQPGWLTSGTSGSYSTKPKLRAPPRDKRYLVAQRSLAQKPDSEFSKMFKNATRVFGFATEDSQPTVSPDPLVTTKITPPPSSLSTTNYPSVSSPHYTPPSSPNYPPLSPPTPVVTSPHYTPPSSPNYPIPSSQALSQAQTIPASTAHTPSPLLQSSSSSKIGGNVDNDDSTQHRAKSVAVIICRDVSPKNQTLLYSKKNRRALRKYVGRKILKFIKETNGLASDAELTRIGHVAASVWISKNSSH